MFCKKCGAPININSNFCTECGTKVEKEKIGKSVKLIVRREKRTLGFAIPFPVYVDGVSIGSLNNGGSLELEVTAGNHLVEFRCAETTVKQDIKLTSEHESVEVVCKARMGLIAAVASIQDVIYK